MALDVTVAGETANSYLSVADADLLAADDLGPDAERWQAAGIPDKERALKRATREIDGFVADIVGLRYSSLQALLFPRALDYIGDPAVPFIHPSLKVATYEQASYVLANAKALDEAGSRRARGLFSFSNPDATGGSVALDPAFGRLSPDVEALLLASFRRTNRVGSVRIRSSIDPLVAI